MHSSEGPIPSHKRGIHHSGWYRSKGQYVGTYMAWESTTADGGEKREIKFYMDGDKEFPTICGTGTEDYFCGSYNLKTRKQINTRNLPRPTQDYPR